MSLMEILQKSSIKTAEFVKLPVSPTTSSKVSAPASAASLDLASPDSVTRVDVEGTPKRKNPIFDILYASLKSRMRNSKRPYPGKISTSLPPPQSSREIVDLDAEFTFPVVPPTGGNPEPSFSKVVDDDPKWNNLKFQENH